MEYTHPIVLSIAGFDPCGGAGVLADIKTIEQHLCLGMAVNTAITKQVEDRFYSVQWISVSEIIEHAEVLFDKYDIHVVKIGIIENLESLNQLVKFLKKKNSGLKIVWDPVLATSTGFNLMTDLKPTTLNEILKDIYLLTPNTEEIKLLTGQPNETEAALQLSSFCNILLKGGHSIVNEGVDLLYTGQQIDKIEKQTQLPVYPKHGSGCILSAAIASELALGNNLKVSCTNAKRYIETILNSNKNLLAYHVA